MMMIPRISVVTKKHDAKSSSNMIRMFDLFTVTKEDTVVPITKFSTSASFEMSKQELIKVLTVCY